MFGFPHFIAMKGIITMSIKEEVLAFSAKVREKTEIDNKTGVATCPLQEIYDSNLPEGISTEMVKQLSDYDSTVIKGTVHAVGTLAIETMKKHKSLEVVTGEFQFGNHNTIGVTTNRALIRKDGLNGGAEVTVNGATSVDITFTSGKNNAQLKAVKNEIKTLAAAAFSSK